MVPIPKRKFRSDGNITPNSNPSSPANALKNSSTSDVKSPKDAMDKFILKHVSPNKLDADSSANSRSTTGITKPLSLQETPISALHHHLAQDHSQI